MSTIDRDMLIKKYINPDIEKFHNSDVKIVLENLKQNILKMLSADRPQGEWKHLKDDEWLCSNCGYVVQIESWWEHPLENGKDYCEHCGARMKGAGNERV